MPLRSFSEAEIALKARRRLERPLLATIWLSSVVFSLAEGNLFYLAVSTFGVVVNLLAVERLHEVYVSRLWVNLAVVGALVILALESFGTDAPGPVALAHFMILIQVCKLFERKTNRDYVQMLALSVLTVVAAALYTQSIWFAGALVVYVVLAAYAAMILTVKRGLDAAAGERLASESAPLSASQVAWNVIREWPGRALATKLTATILWMVAAALAVFVFMPRETDIGAGRWFGGWTMSVTGYSSEVHLGEPRKLQLSDKEVMRLTFGERDRQAGTDMLYLRGRVLQRYRDSGWRPLDDVRRLPPSEPPPIAGADNASTIDISMDSSLLPDLFAPLAAVRWESPAGQCVADREMTATLDAYPPDGKPIGYRVTVLHEPLTDEQRLYLRGHFAPPSALPPSQTVIVPPAVTDLARRWCRNELQARADEPAERSSRFNLAIARKIAGRLREDYTYTLDVSTADPRRDGVEDFLFHMKQGHCEYFASALTAMCRVLDVPARLVTGFLTAERDPANGQYVVRERDAHAWTEVYDGQGRWVVVDATPGSAQALDRGGWLARVDELLGWLKYEWYKTVVGYNADVQRKLLASAWSAVKHAALAVKAGLVNLLLHGQIDAAVIRLAAGLGLVALLLEAALVVRIIRRRRRRRREAAALSAAPWGQLAFVPALLADMERIGLGSRPDRTALQVAGQVAERFALPGEDLAGLVQLYYRARWGGRRPSAEQLAIAMRQAGRFAESADPAIARRYAGFDSHRVGW